MIKRAIIGAMTVGILVLSCAYEQKPPQESEIVQTKKSALQIIQPLLDQYLVNKEVVIESFFSEDLGDGTMAYLPELSFSTKEAEARFYEDCIVLLEKELQEKFSYICEETMLKADTVSSKATTFYWNYVPLGGNLGTACVRVIRYWIIKYYIYFEVGHLSSECDFMQLTLTTNGPDDTNTDFNLSSQSVNVFSNRYKKSQGGDKLIPTSAYLELWDSDFDLGLIEYSVDFID